LNPRRSLRPETVFETAAFDRSATPPVPHRVSTKPQAELPKRDGPSQGTNRLAGENVVFPREKAEKEGFEPSRQGFPHLTP
jgi:hypothetical protein